MVLLDLEKELRGKSWASKWLATSEKGANQECWGPRRLSLLLRCGGSLYAIKPRLASVQ
jgi:hypothetical protein